jgi:hypothetical protein
MGKAEPAQVRPFAQRVRQCCVTGGILLQAILSFMPSASGPQAVVWASLSASDSVAAEAVPLPSAPPKETTTLHSTCWEARVDQRRKPTRARTARRPQRRPFVMGGPQDRCGPRLPGTVSRISLF